MRLGKSPITSPDVENNLPLENEIAIQVIDETLWALIEVLVESGAVDPRMLSDKIEDRLNDGFRRGGVVLSTEEKNDRFAASIVLERVSAAILALGKEKRQK